MAPDAPPRASPLRRLAGAGLRLWELARKEHCAPHEVGWAVGVGVFVGCTPLVGLHAGVAFVAATVLRLNRLWAIAGSRVSFVPLFALISFAEIQTAHHLRTGEWAELSLRDMAARGAELATDWVVGCVFVGGLLGVAVGCAAYGLARRWGPAPPSPPRPSSVKTPSVPPAALPPSSGFPR